MSKPILLYDLQTNLGDSVSFNTLKTKFNLIYKRIPFETVWVAFADVESVSKEHGFAPTSTRPDGSPHYTLPAIRDQETGRAVTDSFAIAQYLDEKYPARPVIPSGTESLQTAFVDGLMATIGTDAICVGSYAVYHAMNEPSKSAYAARVRGFGLDVTTLKKTSPEEQREVLTAALERLAAALDAQRGTNGHFIGDSITFADLAALAYVECFMVVADEPENILPKDGGRWKRLSDEIHG